MEIVKISGSIAFLFLYFALFNYIYCIINDFMRAVNFFLTLQTKRYETFENRSDIDVKADTSNSRVK